MTDLENAVDRYLNNYDDVMKQLPPDGQRQASRFFEIDCRHSHILNKLTKFTKNPKEFTSTDGQRMKKMLIESLDLADRKVDISECLLDMVEKNMLTLNMNYKEFKTTKLCLNKSNKNTKRLLNWTPDYKEIDSDSNDVLNIDNSSKRPKRNITKTTTTTSNKSVENNANLDSKSSTNQNIKNTTNKKSKAHRPKNRKVVSESESSDSDNELQPNYCICEKISYGDMVCCDNDLCPFEWFHFGCVSLRKKPKGKWYCPRCRGTNSKTMKPIEVIRKELEEYNKRKEENW
ncbi:inhibitor of growth protein 1-like [Melanaphis sacchari]|uniref:Inhibitor of growth protein n=1 Tax=Melanaphis sacchari TaxID=742174 RepID=A0A2H8TVW3_9HEMI|nr:inhibitor of growth protein 1-like [Melanaphis sacchari]